MDGADEDRWSGVATEWAQLWGGSFDPVRRAVLSAAAVGAGSRVLDVGCGSGELLVLLDRLGASTAGIDPAPGMVALSRARVPGADVRLGSFAHLPWPDRSFDVVTAFNALQFADDSRHALAEAVRVAVPRGTVAICNWAEADRNDLHTVEAAVARAAGDDVLPDSGTRSPGGLETLLRDSGLHLVAAGVVEVPWEVADDDALVRGVLLGEDEAGMAAGRATVIEAAQPFRTSQGSYRLVNALRYAAGRTPG